MLLDNGCNRCVPFSIPIDRVQGNLILAQSPLSAALHSTWSIFTTYCTSPSPRIYRLPRLLFLHVHLQGFSGLPDRVQTIMRQIHFLFYSDRPCSGSLAAYVRIMPWFHACRRSKVHQHYQIGNVVSHRSFTQLWRHLVTIQTDSSLSIHRKYMSSNNMRKP